MKKEDGRSINRDVLEHLRIQAIRLWKKGKTVEEISDFFGVTLGAIYKWIKIYKLKGLKALKRRKAPGAMPKLSKEELKKLLKVLTKSPDEYGYGTQLWDCKKVGKIIQDKFNKKIHNTNIWRLLKKLGFSYQKPEKIALQKDSKKVKMWIKQEWPKIKEHARRWQAIVYFLDESGISLQPFVGKTWAKKGETPQIKVTAKQGGILLTSAISKSGYLVFRMEKGRLKSKEHIDFLKRIQKHHPNRKIIIMEDNARVHTSKEVKEFIETQKTRLAIYYLPTYSPELNPVEHVWNYLKYVKLNSHQAKTISEFKPLVHRKMKSIQRNKKQVQTFFYGNGLS